MIQGRREGIWRQRAGRTVKRIQSRSCIKLNINNSGLWSVRESHGAGVYPPISIFSSATPRDHNTPASTSLDSPPLNKRDRPESPRQPGLTSAPSTRCDGSLPFRLATYAFTGYYWFWIGIWTGTVAFFPSPPILVRCSLPRFIIVSFQIEAC